VEREDGTLVNYYSLLGLKRSATREDVKTAYRQVRCSCLSGLLTSPAC
jgi:hypothetical protein